MQVVCGLGGNVYYRGSLGMLECREERDSIKVETKDTQKMDRVSKMIEKESI